MLISQFFETIYAPHRLRGKSARSYVLYRLCLRRYAETIGKEPRLSDLTDANLLRHLQRRADVAAATRNKELAELTALWRFAVQMDMHVGWPTITAEHEPQRMPKAWTHDDIHKLLTAAGSSQGQIGKAPASLWWSSLVRTCLDTGERIGALMLCEWNWIEGNSIVVKAEVRKGGKRDKWFRLSVETVSLLRKLREYRESEYIFHWPYCDTYLWSRYRKLLELAGLPTGRQSGLHRLRKTTASVAYSAGLDPQDLLDHTDRRTTQRYLDPRFTRDSHASDIIKDWLRKPPKGKMPNRKTS